MRNLLLVILIIGSTIRLHAQTNCTDCEDLDFLYQAIKNTPSFKDQFKGAKKSNHQNTYDSLRLVFINSHLSKYESYTAMAKFITPVQDNHLGFWITPDSLLSYKTVSDSIALKSFLKSESSRKFPSVSLNLDSLKSMMQKRSADDVEGIYNYGETLTAALYRTPTAGELYGVILSSTLPNWQPGQIAFILFEHQPFRYYALEAVVYDKTFVLMRNERYVNQHLVKTMWTKQNSGPDFSNLPAQTPLFLFKNVSENTGYLRLGSFSANNSNMQAAKKFFLELKDKLSQPSLILDLRNNNGGANKTSNPFLKILKKYASSKKVYILINSRTISNAEQFTLKLSKTKNTIILGERSSGTIAYGSNYGKTLTLPSGRFRFYPTDMNFRKYLPYEDQGIEPQIKLEYNSDWISQTKTIIAKSTQ
jgi:hypothetical protein